LAAAGSPCPKSNLALETLCRAYWYPLYAYVRRRGHNPEDAQDLTQEFFRRLLASDWIARADPRKGRFRTFLLSGLQNFLSNEWQKAHRIKRGRGQSLISLDAVAAEQRYELEPADLASPDKLFDRRWAMTVLESVLVRLESEQLEAGVGKRFRALRPVVLGELTDEGYARLSLQFQVSESTVKSWAHRLRQRYRDLLREEVGQTVGNPKEVNEELRHLLRVLSL
jgi:RNA polymerase sigma-70 factor (ECF subfamily)